jgi:adenosylcobinamide amidohydrolase
MSEDFVPFSERGDDDSDDDLIGMIADAVDASNKGTAENIINELVDSVFEARGEGGILGNFIFAGEVIGEDGTANLMVVTSDNLPDWVARGMIMAADDFIAGGIIE